MFLQYTDYCVYMQYTALQLGFLMHKRYCLEVHVLIQ